MDIYTPISRFVPRSFRLKFRQMIRYSTIEIDPSQYLGFMVFMGFALGFIVATLMSYYDVITIFIGFPVSFIVIELVFYMLVTLSIDKKAKFVEDALPDALQLMSSNIRAGITTDKALLLSARPEFGPLSKEIRRIGKETMSGQSLIISLKKMTNNIKSVNLERTVELIVNSLRSGGKLADLLDQTADDLRDQQMIQKEIMASVLMYVLFIFIAIAMGAPLLFSMSSFLVELLTSNMNMIAAEMPSSVSAGGAMPMSPGNITIGPEFIQEFAIISLVVSSLFGSMVMGLIMGGEEKKGVKYIFPLLIIAISLFLIGKFILAKVLGGMMGP